MKRTNNLQVTLVQPDIVWKSPQENLTRYTAMLTAHNRPGDLVLLPEMFPTGFCTEPEGLAETMDGATVSWMKVTAESLQCALAGSLIIQENDQFLNRLVFVDPGGYLAWYDKRHLFRMGGEENRFSAGLNRLVVHFQGWRLCFLICYDLRFPVWSRNRDDYDALVYVSNWPAARSDVWNTLLRARAIENQSYVIGVNRIGTDGNGISYMGESMVIDPKGQTTGEIGMSDGSVKTFSLSLEALIDFRNKFPVWKDRDLFEVTRDK